MSHQLVQRLLDHAVRILDVAAVPGEGAQRGLGRELAPEEHSFAERLEPFANGLERESDYERHAELEDQVGVVGQGRLLDEALQQREDRDHDGERRAVNERAVHDEGDVDHAVAEHGVEEARHRHGIRRDLDHEGSRVAEQRHVAELDAADEHQRAPEHPAQPLAMLYVCVAVADQQYRGRKEVRQRPDCCNHLRNQECVEHKQEGGDHLVDEPREQETDERPTQQPACRRCQRRAGDALRHHVEADAREHEQKRRGDGDDERTRACHGSDPQADAGLEGDSPQADPPGAPVVATPQGDQHGQAEQRRPQQAQVGGNAQLAHAVEPPCGEGHRSEPTVAVDHQAHGHAGLDVSLGESRQHRAAHRERLRLRLDDLARRQSGR